MKPVAPGDATTDACPICGSRDQGLFGTRGVYRMAVCGACDHVFVVNMPGAEELHSLYEEYSYEERPLATVPSFVLRVLDEVIRTFEPYRRTNRFLDVGFGAGALLGAAHARGWDTYGIEESPLAVRQARDNGLGEIVQGDFLTSPYAEGSFDVIAMDGLIEHIPEPQRFALRARPLLRPDGVLYVTTPHGRGVSARLLGADWSVSAPPEHLHLFSALSLRRCLELAGFSVIQLQTRGFNPYEALAHFRRRGERRSVSGFERVSSAYRLNEKLVGNRAGRIAKGLLNRALSIARAGDTLVVHARRL